jgi:hypothetical protein
MGAHSSQPPAELSEEDIDFISTKAKIDHESVKIWYEKLKVSFIYLFEILLYFVFFSIRLLVLMEKFPKQIQ